MPDSIHSRWYCFSNWRELVAVTCRHSGGSAYRNEEIALLCLVGLLAHEAMCVEGPKRGIAATYILEFHGRLALLGLSREHHEGFGAADSSHFRAVLV